MRHNKCLSRKSAFTLIELLVVVAIIGVLIGILLPSFNIIRNSAKQAATQAEFTAIGTGLDTYRGESALGGSYPPSASDFATNNHLIVDPSQEGTTSSTPAMRVDGAHLLVHAMIGGDGQGPTGFRDFDRDGTWADDTHKGVGGAFELNTTSGAPMRQRYGGPGGSYVDDNMRGKLRSIFDLKSEGLIANWAEEPQWIATTGQQKFFVDSWGRPILYYKANTGSQLIVQATDPPTAKAPPGIYRQQDNAVITGTAIAGGSYPIRGIDFGAGFVAAAGQQPYAHAITSVGRALPPNTDKWVEKTIDDDQNKESFIGFIIDRKELARPIPVRKDSYLLISAGGDARYGTKDDVVNWSR